MLPFMHGISFSSWGEEIIITLTPLTASCVNVDIFSECSMPTQFIDWGKNEELVARIFSYIHSNIYYATTSSNTEKCYCFNRGKSISSDSIFCAYCGKKQM